MHPIPIFARLVALLLILSPAMAEDAPPQPPIPVTFSLEKAGLVTLVIEDSAGRRVRNLLAAEAYEAGTHTVYWDGQTEGAPLQTGGVPGYAIQRELVAPGEYRVRGLVRDEITLTYDFTFYPNTPNTPWPTHAGEKEGGWIGDHGNPHATLYIPAARAPGGEERVLLASSVNEASHGLAWVDLDGNKRKGQRHLGGTWTGASHLAYDRGERAHPDIYAYGRMDWTSKQAGMAQLRITGISEKQDMHVAWPDLKNSWHGGNPGALAVHNCLVVASAYGPDRLLFYDARAVTMKQQATLLGEVPMDAPHALAFEADGSLLVISGDRMLRYRVGAFPEPLSAPEVVIADGLDTPRSLTVDTAGLLYIAEWGESHQIKVFQRDGRLLRTIGNPGGPRLGPLDPQRMHYPYGMTVDSRGQLWVASRRWWTPKTIWVWRSDGTHLRNHYGPTAYGGGGNFDPQEPARFLYHDTHGGVEFKVDWESGTAEPVSIYQLSHGTGNGRWFEHTQPFRFRASKPQYMYRARGHAYITNSHSELANGPGMLMLMGYRGHQAAAPLVLLGKVGDYEDQLKVLGLWEQFDFAQAKSAREHYHGSRKTLFLWTDHNRDGETQAEEFSFYAPPQLRPDPNAKSWMTGGGIISTIEIGDDLSVLIRHQPGQDQPGGVLVLHPQSVAEDGMPIYDLTRIESLVTSQHPQRGVSANVLDMADDRLILTGGPIQGFRGGELEWIYHSQWPSLHKGHAGPRAPQWPGQLIATTRVLGPGFTPTEGEAGEL